MKKITFMLAIIALLSGCGTVAGDRQTGEGRNWVRVARIIDGDTFEIISKGKGKSERVRLIGVDTPETVKPESKVQPFGPEASSFTKKMIEGKMVRLEFDVQERDKYGRLLAYAYLEDGTLLNSRLLEEGLASVMTVPPNVRMADTFLAIQKKTQKQKKGIWQ